MFRRLLIANRGEIALRITRTAASMGIETVVVHSEADRGGPWLEKADRTVCIGPAPASGSYLDAGAILQAAEQFDCQAIHPGYGFLAENASFAARCEQQGITFVGPGAAAIRTMGDKLAAKRAMAAAGLATIPGSAGVLADRDQAVRVAAEVGYPVLLKAAAGGGGKGMRACEREADLLAGFGAASLEAEKAFGDPSLYLEKRMAGARHIEFQVLCDGFGEGLHLGERECSIQRKHQKLVEECPSPVIDAATRDDLGRRAAAAVAALGYRNAGTVEFLRDPAGRFYFLEMNTRLQVEHPVTELTTGVDMVALQLAIAANRPLELTQDDVTLEGHAIEFRINAEDPDDDFRPSPGRIESFSAPGSRRGVRVRWDSAVAEGYTIPPYYDSMVGKLIVHAADRARALRGASKALEDLRIGGVKTTLAFHRSLLRDSAFGSGDYDIDFLAERDAVGGKG